MMRKKLFKIFSKVALCLVIFGFFQPVACEQQGFELAESLIEMGETNYLISAIGLYITFFAAAISILYTLILLIAKKDVCASKVNKFDFVFIFLSIIGGLVTFLFIITEFEFEFINHGFYIIASGWLLSLILSFFRK